MKISRRLFENRDPLRLGLVFLLTLLAGCSSSPPEVMDSAPGQRMDPDKIADATPRTEPRSRYGNPKSYVVRGRRYHVLKDSQGFVERGIASWYGTKFHGRRTSSGEPYDMYKMTAAHKSLPLPSYARVTNLRNGRSAVVKVNDRGPFHENRIIDLSYAAATKLGILSEGTGVVEVRVVDPGNKQQIAEEQPPITPHPDLFIQVGAFLNRPNADRLSRNLSHSLNRTVRVRQAGTAQQPVFRVQVGPLASVGQADALTPALTREGISEMHIVIE